MGDERQTIADVPGPAITGNTLAFLANQYSGEEDTELWRRVAVLLGEVERLRAYVAWAREFLGSPNGLKPELQRWIRLGETCADGLKRANAEITRLLHLYDLRVVDGRIVSYEAALAALAKEEANATR